MNQQEHLLAILYDLSQTICAESKLQALLEKFLQRLMFHTGYSSGLIISQEKKPDGKVYSQLRVSIGDPEAHNHIGQSLDLPAILDDNRSIKPNDSILNSLPIRQNHYQHSLIFPIPDFGFILLLAVEAVGQPIPDQQVFTPIFLSLSQQIKLCQRSEAYLNSLVEEKQLEEPLRHSQKMEALGNLAGGIAHDYNNLLGIILGYVEQLSMQIDKNSALFDDIGEIRRTAERGVSLNKKLSSFSRQKSSSHDAININEILQDQQDMLQKTLSVDVSLTLDLTSDLWTAEIDGVDLQDAVVNMVINAMHAMNGKGTVTITTRNLPVNSNQAQSLNLLAGDYVLLSLSDTGCGMPDSLKEKIFDPFFTTKGKSGAGLGLSQVYGFVKRSSGEIKVFSQIDQGTRFELYFPRSHRILENTHSIEPVSNHHLGGEESILIVDDEPAMLKLTKELLSQKGYRILMANNGLEALEVLKNNRVDLVISDVLMRGMDGYQLAEQILQHYPGIKIQLVSGYAESYHDKLSDKSIVQNMLYKPYDLELLYKQIRSLLDKNKAKQSLDNVCILVMDDDDDIRTLYEINLKKLGCQTIAAIDGEQAINKYLQAKQQGQRIDVMIMDLSIPGGLGGKEVVARLKTSEPDLKFIISSGYSDAPEMLSHGKFGFDAAIEKNFNSHELQRVLEDVLNI